MIVVATNNGFIYLKELLDSFKDIDLCNEKIFIIDTISNDINHLNFLKQINNLYPNLDIEITTTPHRKFDTGAYIYAYQNINSDNYIFLHDSVTIKNKNFIKVVKEQLNENNVVSFSCFNFMGYGGNEWKDFFKNNTNEEKYEIGFFGPMFACKKSVLDKINFENLILPTNKNQQACFEGIWPTLFKKNNIEIICMDQSSVKFESEYLSKKIIHRD